MAGKSRGRRRKKGNYTPLVWLLTALIIGVFFYFSSGNFGKFQLFQGFKVNSASSGVAVVSNSGTVSNAVSSIQDQIAITQGTGIISNKINVSGEMEVKIFLAKQTGNKVTIVEKKVQVSRSNSPMKTALQALVNYRGSDLLNLVPLNTRIKKVWIRDSTAYVDFSNEFSYNSYGLIGYKIQIYQVVYTAAQFANISSVYFYMDGKPLNYLGGDGYGINNPVFPFTSIPEFSL